ncbi:MAG: fibronectin type III domain-containing protein [Bacteroidales bacterium]|nr:fibronectin type III domain-containing protein [Bacteroidales bacterium]
MKKFLFLLLTMMVGFFTTLSAQSVTVANGTTENSYLPVYGLWLDSDQHNQIIYPESLLTNLLGETISGIMFYLASPPYSSWTSTITIGMGITSNASFSVASHDTSTLTTCCTGVPLVLNGNTLTLAFSTPFTYNGGNLLIDITTVGGDYSDATFYGITSAGGGLESYTSYSGNVMEIQNFIPKTTFISGNCSMIASVTTTDITNNSATISWAASSSSSYDVYLGNMDDDLTNVVWESTTDTFYTFSNLNANTTYTAFVRNNCGNEVSVPSMFTFSTACGIMTVPYVDGFENYTIGSTPSCWTLLNPYNNWGDLYPLVADSYAHTGNNSLMFEADGDDPNPQFAILPAFAQDITDLQISFFTRREGASSGTLQVGYVTNLTQASSFVSLLSISASQIGDNDYHKYTVEFSNVNVDPDSTVYIAFGYTCANYWYWYVDDITVDFIPACSEPVGMTASNITTTTATVSWVPGSTTSFNLYYKKNADTAYTEVLSMSDTTYLIENLDPASTYQWYVTAICDDGSLVNSEVKYFLTACAALTSLPYANDFETIPSDLEMPHCWTRGNESSGDPYIDTYNAHSGSHDISFYYTNTLALPEIDTTEIDISQTIISFYAFAPYDATTLQVGMMTNPYISSTFVPVGSPVTLTENYEQYEVSLASYTGNGTYIAFRNPTQYQTLYLDDVTLDFIPDCSRPDAVWAQQVDTSSATIEWSTFGSQTSWEIVYGPHGFSPDTVTPDIATTSSYTIDNLSSNTTYDVYVRTDCGSEFSSWSNVISFTTLLTNPATVPYFCDFEDSTENNAWFLVNGNETNKWYFGTATAADSSSHSMYISQDNGTSNMYDGGSASIVWAYRDIQFSNADEFELSFDWKCYGESTWDFLRVYIGAPSAVMAGDMTTPTGATQLDQLNLSTSWTHASYTLGSSYNGATRRLYFMWRNDYSVENNPPIAIDNISIVGFDCAQPAAITLASFDTTSATLSITPSNTNQSEWEVLYGTSDTTMNTITVTSTTFTLDNLTPASEYTVYVRTLCDNGDTSSSISTSFSTECTHITTLPQTWDFENNNSAGTIDYPMPACWEKGIASSTYPYVYDYESHNGTHSLYFYNYNQNFAILPIIDTNILPINSLQLSFYARATSLSYYDAKLIVGVLSDVNNPLTFVPIDTIELTENYPTMPYEVLFNHYTGNGNRIAIRNYSTDSYAYNSIYIDDAILDIAPSCLPISNLQMVGNDQTSITLDWIEGSSETSWNVEYKEASDTEWTSLTAYSMPFTISGLTGSTLYNIRVQADCGGGDVSPWRFVDAHTTVCDSASQCSYTFTMYDSYGDGWNGGILTIKQNGISVAEISLSDGASGTAQVTLCDNMLTTLEWTPGMYSDEPSFSVADPSNVTIYTSPNMDSYTTYSFTSDCLLSACSATSLPTVSNIGTTTATIDWTPNGTETSWNVEYKTASDATWTVVAVTSHPYNLTGLTTGTAYDVRVQADCGAGEVSSYRQTSFTTALCDAADQCTYTFNLTDGFGDGWNGASITIMQNGLVVGSVGENFSGSSSTETVTLCDSVSTTLVWVSGMYDDECSFTVTDPSGTVIFTSSGIPSGTITTFTSDCGGSTPSACPTPTGLAVNNVTQTSATANWIAGGTETSWNVAFKQLSSSTWTTVTTSIPSFTMTGLTPATAYQVKVQAICEAKEYSEWTNPVSFTTEQEQQQTCPAPTNLTATIDATSHTTVTLTWQQEANTANEWQINYRQTTESTWSTATATSTTYTLTDLTPNVDYEANVVAHCTNGLTSDPSNTVTWHTDDVGIAGYLEKAVNLYPNPATEMIAVEVSDANIMITGVEVYNVYGKLINTIISTENPLRINVSGLANGMYYVRVTTDGGVVTKNFVKR